MSNRYKLVKLFLESLSIFRQINSISWSLINHDYSISIDDLILPTINFGSWEIQTNLNEHLIIYRVCTNPGGDIPIWIVVQANQRYLPQLLLDLVYWVKSHK